MLGRRGADVHKAVGAWRSNRRAGSAYQCKCNGMAGHTHGHSFQASRDQFRHQWTARQYQCQRPRPELLGQLFYLFRKRTGQVLESIFASNMYNQRITKRAALGGKNTFHCTSLKCISPKTIHRLSRENYYLACPYQSRCTLNFCFLRMNRINLYNFCMDMLHPAYYFHLYKLRRILVKWLIQAAHDN